MRENLFCLNLNAECIEFAGGLGKLQMVFWNRLSWVKYELFGKWTLWLSVNKCIYSDVKKIDVLNFTLNILVKLVW